MGIDYTIALAQPQQLEALAGIELAAAMMLKGQTPASVLAETTPEDTLRRAQQVGRLWVALAGEIPVGFAHVEMLAEDFPHLQEMDVHPDHGRRGLGTALLRTVIDWLAHSGHPQMTLTTFRTVPWNMPFYARLGFEEIHPDELRPELVAVLRDEADRGLDPARRVAMRYRVNKSKEHREIETRFAQAYAGEAGSLLEEIEPLMGQQSWPSD